jgi:hypothetical protein
MLHSRDNKQYVVVVVDNNILPFCWLLTVYKATENPLTNNKEEKE